MSLLLLKELIIIFLFVVTAAGVVPCGIPKKRPLTSPIVQFMVASNGIVPDRTLTAGSAVVTGTECNSFKYIL